MYFREIESNQEAARQHTDILKKNAAERLRANQEYNRRNKSLMKRKDK